MSASVQIELGKDLARHLRDGHPWVFRQALRTPPRLPAGTVVDVTGGGRFVARGLFDPHSPIAVRLLSSDAREEVGPALWRRRIERAHALRLDLLDLRETDAYRLVHGENDFLPGVVVDLYAGFAVLKLYSAAWTPHRAALVEALRLSVPGLRGVLGRDEIGDGGGGRHGRPAGEGRRPEPSTEAAGGGKVLWGEAPPDKLRIRENGMSLFVDVRRGQKTGLFLDQRDNRAALRRYARGREVLNCFCYTGGFSVSAGLGGARRVTSVDLDRDAVALARENFSLNGLSADEHEFVVGDVFDLLSRWKMEGRSFDVVVLDPPAFAKSQEKVPAALAGYASLNRAALQLVRPGGTLFSCSCSARVSDEAFAGAIAEAARKLGVALQLVEERHQPADHPILLSFAQGRYLKCLVYRGS